MHVLILLETLLFTKVFKLTLVPYGSQKSFSSADVFLAITTNFQSFLVVLETDIGAELLDVTSEPDAIFAQT